MRHPTNDRLILALLAIAGVVGGHSIGYRLAHFDAAEHARTLQLSGHGYWGLATSMGLIAGLAAIFLGLALVTRRRSFSAPGPTWGRLAVIQVGGFALMEVVERVVSGVGALQALSEPAVWIGPPLQLAVAVVAVVVLRAAARAGAALGAGGTLSPAGGAVGVLTPPVGRGYRRVARVFGFSRAPPVPA